MLDNCDSCYRAIHTKPVLYRHGERSPKKPIGGDPMNRIQKLLNVVLNLVDVNPIQMHYGENRMDRRF